MPTKTNGPKIGKKIIDFNLLGVDGNWYTIKNTAGPNGLLVMFICNHCPYVKSIISKLADDTRTLRDEYGLKSVAIMPNDYDSYPDDSYEKMQEFSKIHNLPFPYLLDDTQEIAKAYGAVCTPDFFGYNKSLTEQYRGRFDSSGKEKLNNNQDDRELFIAMKEIAMTEKYLGKQISSIGCSIKWKT